MASDLMDKLKETLQPTGEESHGVHFGTSQQTEQRESVPSNTRTENLESRRVEQTHQTEGVRTGDKIESLVENVPGVPSTQAKPERTETHREDIHRVLRDPCDAAQAPPFGPEAARRRAEYRARLPRGQRNTTALFR
ncbi:hypothetical protein CDV31_002473 [Fusarium ambrosium]|uniref:Uncharacterized protein n=1 Tax=Fusarium ambrosium TaxID=131363 RepID=A0A428UWS0_9HYPO|nr:hypothetical protein CDV31_002473 [Fusarium ambrosium]